MFTEYQVSQTLLSRLSEEYANLKYLYNTLGEYALSECMAADVKSQVHNLNERLFSLLMDYDLISELVLLSIQEDTKVQSHYF